MLCLPDVAELGDGARLAVRHEDRVVAEALVSSSAVRDRAVQRPCRAHLAAVGSEHDELAHVARAAVRLPVELEEKLRDAVLGPPGRVHAGPPAERGDLDAGVLARDPRVGGSVRAAVPGLDPRVVEERRAVLDRLVGRLEERDLPLRKRSAKLAELVLVARREKKVHAGGVAAACACAAASSSIPPAARSSSASSSSREKGSRSAVACTSTSLPSPVMTTFMSVSALESSS